MRTFRNGIELTSRRLCNVACFRITIVIEAKKYLVHCSCACAKFKRKRKSANPLQRAIRNFGYLTLIVVISSVYVEFSFELNAARVIYVHITFNLKVDCFEISVDTGQHWVCSVWIECVQNKNRRVRIRYRCRNINSGWSSCRYAITLVVRTRATIWTVRTTGTIVYLVTLILLETHF